MSSPSRQTLLSRAVLAACASALLLAGCTLSSSGTNRAGRDAAAPNGAASPEIAAAVAALATDPALYETRTFEWRDAARERDVPTRLYLPLGKPADATLPLVVFSHGIGGSREGYKYLGRHFAAKGYASLHLQHIGSDRQLWFGNPFGLLGRLTGAASEGEAIDRARDFSFALSQLLASELGARIDPARIIAAGHSYGANTTLLVAGAVIERDGQALNLRDPRVKAALLLSAPPFYGSSAPEQERILRDIPVPTLHITATGDDIEIPGYRSGVNDRLEIYNSVGSQTGAAKVLAVFKGGSHSIFTDRLGTGGMELNPQVKRATRDLAVSFLDSIFNAPTADNGSLAHWRDSNAALIDRFETKVP